MPIGRYTDGKRFFPLSKVLYACLPVRRNTMAGGHVTVLAKAGRTGTPEWLNIQGHNNHFSTIRVSTAKSNFDPKGHSINGF